MNDTIKYRLFVASDRENVRKFYEDHFLADEPLAALSEHNPDHEGLNAFTDLVIDDAIKSRVSTLAEDTVTGDIVGIRLCSPSTAEEPNFYTISEKYTDPAAARERKSLQMYKDIHEGVDVFKTYSVQEAVHLYACSVHGDQRGKGIAGKMNMFTITEAKKLGFHLAYVEVTSNSSRRVFDKLGFTKLKEINFEEYFGEKLDTGEHKFLSLHVKEF